jgi:hypothetical protein
MAASEIERWWFAWRDELAQTVQLLLDIPRVNVDMVANGPHESNVTAYVILNSAEPPRICIGRAFFQSLLKHDGYMLLKATVYHELAHVLLTTDTFITGVRQFQCSDEELWRYVWNSMEDNRVEAAISKKWVPMKRFFRLLNSTMLTEVVDGLPDDQSFPASADWLLYAYRFGIPDEVKAAARTELAKMVGPQAMDIITDAYQRFMLTGEVHYPKIVYQTLEEANADSKDFTQDSPPPPPDGLGAVGTPENPLKVDESLAPDDLTPPPPGQPLSEQLSADDLKDAIKAEVEAAEADEHLAHDSQISTRAIASRASKSARPQVKDTPFRLLSVSPDMAMSEKTVLRTLRRLRHGLDDEWQQDSLGKLDGRQFLTRHLRPGNYDYFRHLETGGEAAGSVHVVLALDISSSMQGSPIMYASQAAWVLQRSLSAIDAQVDVLIYNQSLYVPEPAPAEHSRYRLYTARGGTAGAPPAKAAYESLVGSRARNRFYVCLTDGQFQDVGEAKKATSMLNGSGIITALFSTDTPNMNIGFAINAHINTPMDLVPATAKLVANSLNNARRFKS